VPRRNWVGLWEPPPDLETGNPGKRVLKTTKVQIAAKRPVPGQWAPDLSNTVKAVPPALQRPAANNGGGRRTYPVSGFSGIARRVRDGSGDAALPPRHVHSFLRTPPCATPFAGQQARLEGGHLPEQEQGPRPGTADTAGIWRLCRVGEVFRSILRSEA
jgi:hypothetical protein